MTRVVLRFLGDYRDRLYGRAFQAFLAGRLNDQELQDLRGRYAICDDMLEIQWETLCAFYDCPELLEEEEKES